MAYVITGGLIAAYGYHVWRLGRLGWPRRPARSRLPARVVHLHRRPAKVPAGVGVAVLPARAAGGSRV